MIDQIQADILITGDLSPEERQKYLKLLNDVQFTKQSPARFK